MIFSSATYRFLEDASLCFFGARKLGPKIKIQKHRKVLVAEQGLFCCPKVNRKKVAMSIFTFWFKLYCILIVWPFENGTKICVKWFLKAFGSLPKIVFVEILLSPPVSRWQKYLYTWKSDISIMKNDSFSKASWGFMISQEFLGDFCPPSKCMLQLAFLTILSQSPRNVQEGPIFENLIKIGLSRGNPLKI